MSYEVVIGVEVHAQLRTQSKLFCSCGTVFGGEPNTQTCPVCLGMPGSLPVLNRLAVDMAIRVGLALQCTIRTDNHFARKNYFYPDLPKGYQISQYEAPICENGWLDIDSASKVKRVRIRRAHLEEDAGKTVHQPQGQDSYVDLNRTGTPLLEIVTEPDLRSGDDVDTYLRLLRDILMYLDVCDGNMEQGNLRCEPNISLRPVGAQDFGTKVELKNINSFRFVHEAIEYEVSRQTQVLSNGGTIHQETRLWDEVQGRTVVMRSKEEAHDYRYFPDPDLLPLHLDQDIIDSIQATLPELPGARKKRMITAYALPDTDAALLTSSKALADYFESCVELFPFPKTVCNWVKGELLHELHAHGVSAQESELSPERLVQLLQLVEDDAISLKAAREIFSELYDSGKDPKTLIDEKGLSQVSDDEALLTFIRDVLANHPTQVRQYQDGKEAVLGFFVGQVMKASKGKANPGKVNALLKTALVNHS
ncbi:MAG: Asp-tRNA(Asn)/Glu-tRNA(Gln) amidotransferase subunit GatB [Nitrospirales bacterium]|nr:Asp-tRNA(Asn)/Glu-tRNA(Gln) amidotransferase subunit GatB [Nitrospira sp.]MDR4502608.1 Asp-tRNA(Asn)/Glu-tRNA(Gln) amidotransferase subunit GatB [Nitrospirales bacterium]